MAHCSDFAGSYTLKLLKMVLGPVVVEPLWIRLDVTLKMCWLSAPSPLHQTSIIRLADQEKSTSPSYTLQASLMSVLALSLFSSKPA